MSIMLETGDYYKMRKAQEAKKRGCKDCVYWDRDDAIGMGDCHHLSPVHRESRQTMDATWLVTDGPAWCGDWLPREANDGGGE